MFFQVLTIHYSTKSNNNLNKGVNMVDKLKDLNLMNKNYPNGQEEFPKLRRPKESTLQKIRANQKKDDDVKVKPINIKDT